MDLKLLTLAEASKTMGISISSFNQNVKPHVPRVQIGEKYYYDPKDLEAFIQSRKVNLQNEEEQK